MPAIKPLEVHGIVGGKNPPDTLTAAKAGNLVVPPAYGPRAKLPVQFDLMAFTELKDDFYFWQAAGTNVGGWKTNAIGNGLNAGPLISASYSLNGEVDFATDNTAIGDGAHFEWDAPGIINLASARPYWFSARFYIATASSGIHARIGISANTANPFAADPNGIYFVIGETNGKIGTIVKNAAGTTETADHGKTIAADTWYEIAFYYDGTDLKLYLDRDLLGTVTTNIPTGIGLAPFFAAITHTAGANKVLALDFIQVVSLRPDNA